MYTNIILGFLIGIIIAESVLKENEKFYNLQQKCNEVPGKVTDGINKVMTGITTPVTNAMKKVGNDISNEFTKIKNEVADATIGNITRELNNAYTLMYMAIKRIFDELPFLKFLIMFLPILTVLTFISPFLVIIGIFGLLFGWAGIFIAISATAGFFFWLYSSAMAVKDRFLYLFKRLYSIFPFDKLLSVFGPLKKIPDKLKEIFNKINIIPDINIARNVGNVFKAIFNAICAAVGAVEKGVNTTKNGIKNSINTAFVNPINGIVRTVNKIPGVNAKELRQVNF